MYLIRFFKKTLPIIILFLGSVFLNPIFKADSSLTNGSLNLDGFGSTITINYLSSLESQESINKEIIDLVYKYNYLTDNFYSLPEESTLKNNVYSINHSEANSLVQIDKELFDLLKYSYNLSIKTNGYFNFLMGEVIDIWKEVTMGGEFYRKDLTKEKYDTIVSQVNSLSKDYTIDFVEEENNYYVKINENSQIDLGAIAKGYVVNLIKEVILKYNVTTYLINGGSSSIALGEAQNDDLFFKVGLSNPLIENKYISLSNSLSTYASIKLKNKSVSSSNWGTDFAYYNESILPHIISPITFHPASNIYSITLIGEDAGLLDGLSTALYSMEYKDIKPFLENFKEDDVEAIILKKDIQVETIFNEDSNYEMEILIKNDNKTNTPIIIIEIGAPLLVISVAISILITNKKKLKPHEKE